MKKAIWTCPPNAQYRFGKIALDEHTSLNSTSEIMHSDTLTSCIIATGFNVFSEDKATEFAELFTTGKTKISSLFFYLKLGEKTIFFLPKPIHYNLGERDNYKAVKKVRFISEEVWKNGWLPEEWETNCLIIQDKFVLAKSELPDSDFEKYQGLKIYTLNTLPKVVVHKSDRENSIFAQTNIQLAANWNWQKANKQSVKVGWYFLFDHEKLSETELNDLLFVLDIITDQGIGGEKNTGCGELSEVDYLEIQKEDFGNDPVHQSAISLILPKKEEFSNLKFYDIITRGGRKTAKHGTLNRVKMLTEGALIHNDVKGKSINLSQDSTQAYWRCGYSLNLPIHSNTLKNATEYQ